MIKKLTLSIDEAVIEKSKAYVDKQGISLSSLVENLLKLTTGTKGTRNDFKKSKISDTPNVDAIQRIHKRMRSPKEQEKYLKELYSRKSHMKEWFEMREEKYGL